MAINEALFSSDSSEWETPDDLFDHYNRIFRLEIDLAASAENAKLPYYLTQEMDALIQPWSDMADVGWLNPPYGRGIGAWLKKCREEQLLGFTTVVLLPARTDTKWFHEWVLHKADITFLKGRLTFKGAPAGAPFPSMIAVYVGKLLTNSKKS